MVLITVRCDKNRCEKSVSTKLGVTENFVSSLYLLLIQSSTLKSVLSTVLTALATLSHVYIYGAMGISAPLLKTGWT